MKDAEDLAVADAAQHRDHLPGVEGLAARAEEGHHRAHARAHQELRAKVELLEELERAHVHVAGAAAAAGDHHQGLLVDLAVHRLGLDAALHPREHLLADLAGTHLQERRGGAQGLGGGGAARAELGVEEGVHLAAQLAGEVVDQHRAALALDAVHARHGDGLAQRGLVVGARQAGPGEHLGDQRDLEVVEGLELVEPLACDHAPSEAPAEVPSIAANDPPSTPLVSAAAA